MPGQRLDKWLWCARLAKTRTGAARLIEAGKVRVNGDRALKSSRLVQAGDVVTAAFLGTGAGSIGAAGPGEPCANALRGFDSTHAANAE
jgi:ribosome-associated heat shock protein Hsp15